MGATAGNALPNRVMALSMTATPKGRGPGSLVPWEGGRGRERERERERERKREREREKERERERERER